MEPKKVIFQIIRFIVIVFACSFLLDNIFGHERLLQTRLITSTVVGMFGGVLFSYLDYRKKLASENIRKSN